MEEDRERREEEKAGRRREIEGEDDREGAGPEVLEEERVERGAPYTEEIYVREVEVPESSSAPAFAFPEGDFACEIDRSAVADCGSQRGM